MKRLLYSGCLGILDIDKHKTYNPDCGYFSPLLAREGLFAEKYSTYSNGKDLKQRFNQFIIISQRDIEAYRKILERNTETTAIYRNLSCKKGRGLIAISSPQTKELCEELGKANNDGVFRSGYPGEGSLFELIAEYGKREGFRPGDLVTFTKGRLEWLERKGFLKSLPALEGIIDSVRDDICVVLFGEGTRVKEIYVENEHLVRLPKNEDSPC
jgi:hypothetical protein